jgi:hypothetical protein
MSELRQTLDWVPVSHQKYRATVWQGWLREEKKKKTYVWFSLGEKNHASRDAMTTKTRPMMMLQLCDMNQLRHMLRGELFAVWGKGSLTRSP